MSLDFSRLDLIFQQAIEQPPEGRPAFLDIACEGDAALRAEIEDLLRYHDQPLGALDQTLGSIRRAALVEVELEIGQRIGSYTILELLGTGGMGRVYLAQDSRLDRKVALKFLLPEGEQSGRLEREVKAVSALNHPNILTVHEIGSWDNRPFLVSEYVRGKTLRARLEEGPLPVEEIQRVGLQVGSALEAAHSSGFMHRDIKPENIMVRDDGLVKLLDFGLAKRVEATPSGDSYVTNTGVIAGTAAYMSPEQLSGRRLDGRTDLWSLGVVLWEMASGKSPFRRVSVAETIAAILAPDEVEPEVSPAWLRRVVERCLRKDPAARYAGAGELIVDLDTHAQQQRWHWRPGRQQISRLAGRTGSPRGWMRVLAVALILGLLAASVLWYRRSRAESFSPQSLARLTVQGRPSDVAISPDGRYIAYVSLESSQASIWVRQNGPESDVRIVPPRQAKYAGLSFSRDSGSLYYVVYEGDGGLGKLYRIAVIGGESRLIRSNVDSAPAFSADGRRMVFLRAVDGRSQLILVDEDGRERLLAERRPPQNFEFPGVAWSPVADEIAVIAGERGTPARLATVRVSDGRLTLVGESSWQNAAQPAWTADGRSILLVGFGKPRMVARLIQVSYPRGEVRELLPNDLGSYRGLSVSVNPPGLVSLRAEELMGIWLIGEGQPPRTITMNAGRYRGVALLNDGVVTQSDLSGKPDLWRISLNGASRVRLTDDEAYESDPVVCGDGRTVVFRSTGLGRSNLWRVDSDGLNPRALTTGTGPDTNPSCAANDRWVYYTAYQGPMATLWKVTLSGDSPQQVTRFASAQAAISPDGRRLASFVYDDAAAAEGNVAVIDAASGKILSRLKGIPRTATLGWHPNGREIVYVQTINGVSNLVGRSLDGVKSPQFTQFDTEQISGYAWSGDGKRLAVVRGFVQFDLIRIGGSGTASTGN